MIDHGDDEVLGEDGVVAGGSPPRRIGELVRALAGRRRWEERLEGAVVFRRWHELVGPELAMRCEPVRLAGGVLTIRAESSAWATEVRYLAGALTDRAAEVLRPGLVQRVRVVVGPLQATPAPTERGERRS
ncbi:MAG TPA: DUF721 domain-containing protein [Nitriliruptorales bacterium]|nr:DUF721 domain-containing protein [Nitriliruptorales bacterium]